ncbi:MAG: rhodanese-like domain-containing protein [Chitinophagales bacterium]|nr:rhodanese-like domain-containing protein [Chitinophagales bacterium]
MIKEITVQELKQMIDNGHDFQLIDVREPHEYEICNLNGLLIPMNEVPDQTDKFDRQKTVVVHCRSGARSARVIEYLQNAHGFTNLYNLKGGILAWADEIDPSIQKY